MMHRSILLLWAISVSSYAAELSEHSPDSVIYLTKNTNRNQVHYGVHVDQSCRPMRKKPVYAYWRMLEKGPHETAGLMFWEQPGYGVKQPKQVNREVNSGSFEFLIRGVPQRRLRLETFTTDNGCRARAYTRIGDQEAVFERIEIEVSGWANVHKVEIFGRNELTGEVVSEITHQD